MEGSEFSVEADENQFIAQVKEEIKQKSDGKIDIPCLFLRLFIAQTAAGEWLDEAGAAAVKPDDLLRFTKIDPTWPINSPMNFGKKFQPAEGQVHVLVLVPRVIMTEIGLTAPDYTQMGTGDCFSAYNATHLSFWQSLQALIWPVEKSQPTKKDD